MPAPSPAAGRSSNTRPASRQYLPRVEEAAVRRPAPSSDGAVLVSLVSSSTRSPMPPLNAAEVNATSGTAHAMTSATIPIRRPTWTGGRPRLRPALTSAPATTSPRSITSSSRPNSPATLSLTRSGSPATENASWDSAHAPTAPAPSDGRTIAGSDRSRTVGTIAIQATVPITAATSAPRDCESSSASTAAPSAG